MVQIKTGHESPVRVVLGPNCRPPNSSHFGNLKCLKIGKVVSQKKKKKWRETEVKKEGKKREEGREEGRQKARTHSGNVSQQEYLTQKEGTNA